MKRRRPESWPLDELHAECPSACAVWIALRDMRSERGSRIVTPTRTQLMRATGIAKPATISKALTALEHAGWIDREHVPVFEGGRQTATLLRVVTRRDISTERHRGRKRGATGKSAVEAHKGHKGKGRKRAQDFPKGKGVPKKAHPLPGGTGSRAPTGSAGLGVAKPDPPDDGPMIPIAEALGLKGGNDG